MEKQNHVIKKQILDVTLDSEIGSFAFQSKLSEVFKAEILPRLDAYCTEIGGDSEILRLDRLELDLGVLDKRTWAQELISKFDEVFPQKLRTVFPRQEREGDRPALSRAVQNSHPGGRVTLTPQDRNFQLFTYFIKTGRLPWWVKKDESPEMAGLLEEMISKEPAKIRDLLRGMADDRVFVERVLYHTDKATRKKLIALFQPPQAVTLCDKLVAALVETFKHSPFFRGFSIAKLETEIWVVLLKQILASAGQSLDQNSIAAGLLKHLAKEFGYAEQALSNYLAGKVKGRKGVLAKIPLLQPRGDGSGPTGKADQFGPEDFEGYARAYWQQLENIAGQLKEFSLLLPKEQRLLEVSLGDELSGTLNRAVRAIQEIKAVLFHLQEKAGPTKVLSLTGLEMDEEQQKRVAEFTESCERLYLLLEKVLEQKAVAVERKVVAKAEQIMSSLEELRKKARDLTKRDVYTTGDEEIFLRNAGLVILWPYLPALFERTALVKDQKFVGAEAQERAVLLLHYLAFGLENGQEYEMTLNKILCGFGPGRPVNPCLARLTPAEIREGDELLQAVIHHWPALKKMSVPALRSMFLRREGMLFTRDGWRVLKVEEETYDPLLDHLPWGIGTVRLPWMEEILLVEWRR